MSLVVIESLALFTGGALLLDIPALEMPLEGQGGLKTDAHAKFKLKSIYLKQCQFV